MARSFSQNAAQSLLAPRQNTCCRIGSPRLRDSLEIAKPTLPPKLLLHNVPSPSSSSSKPTEIVVVDDHPLFRIGVANVIDAQPGLRVVGEAADAKSGLDLVLKLKPRLVVIDVSLEDQSGLELLRNILAVRPATLALMISMHDETLYAQRAIAAGARGYIMKTASLAQIVAAVNQIIAGSIYLSPEVANSLLEQLAPRKRLTQLPTDKLTEREFEIFQLIAEGHSSEEMAKALKISARTVSVHLTNIRRKLELKHNAALAHFAIKWVADQPKT